MGRNLPRAADDALDALGNAHRRAILELLAAGPRSVGQVADALPISRPAVSRHLRVLADARLVTCTPEGASNRYRLQPSGADQVRRYLDALWSEATQRFKIFAENTLPEDPQA
jgi:DNA-binding transcriptional ArsR family regulator